MRVYPGGMLDSNTKGLFVLLIALGATACGTDDDKSNPVPVKDAGADAPADAPSDAKTDAPAEGGMPGVDAGADANLPDAAPDAADAATE